MTAPSLAQGANLALPAGPVTVTLLWGTGDAAVSLDASCFLLGADGKVRGDDDFLFYNAPAGPGLGWQFAPGRATLSVDPAALPPAVTTVALCLTATRDGVPVPLARAAPVTAEVAGPAGPLATLAPDVGETTALTVAQLYRREGGWRVRHVGQGFAGGLAPLARSFGVDVAEEAPPPPPPAPARVSLDKARPAIDLRKPAGASFGAFEINLEWSKPATGAVDLDLHALVELASGEKCLVQALERQFGSLSGAPFVALDGDDRTGAHATGETLRVAGGAWDRLRRIIVYASIYAGAPRWSATDALVTLRVPGQPEVTIRLSEAQDGLWFCALALLENIGGDVRVTRLERYFDWVQALDDAYGWGWTWRRASKD